MSFYRKKRNQLLRRKYGISMSVDQGCFDKLMSLLIRIDGGEELCDQDKLWFKTEGRSYYTTAIAAKCGDRDAGFFVNEYRRTGDPSFALAASRYLRQHSRPDEARELLSSVPLNPLSLSKLRSEFFTELGTILADLGLSSEALKLAEDVHALSPDESAPCALAGTVNLELGRYTAAMEWLAKAVDRGAAEHCIDRELRIILRRADQPRRSDIRTALLSSDPHRFQWVDTFVAA